MTRPILYAPHNFDDPGGIEECIPYNVVTAPHRKFRYLSEEGPQEEALNDHVLMLGRFPIDPIAMFEGQLTFILCLN